MTALDDAMASEMVTGEDAALIRGESTELTLDLFLKLWPLLRRPIPDGFIKTTGVVKGKPYPSTGVSSVQVQITRMDNVLTPAWWWDKVEYHEEGRLARVRVGINAYGRAPLYVREAWGGVNQASTTGNLYKGSYTNAAKVAFARVGPGWEVYLGATDFDPDTDENAAKEQAKPRRGAQASTGPRPLTDEERAKVVKAIEDAGNDEDGLTMILGAVGAESTDDLTTAQAFEIRKLLDEAKS
jgi:hypothetical protein